MFLFHCIILVLEKVVLGQSLSEIQAFLFDVRCLQTDTEYFIYIYLTYCTFVAVLALMISNAVENPLWMLFSQKTLHCCGLPMIN